MLRPGRYKAVTPLAVERCLSNGERTAPAVLEYTSYEAGEEFEIPQGVNGFFHRVMEDPFREDPAGRWERITQTPGD
jgi:hypothetical protein